MTRIETDCDPYFFTKLRHVLMTTRTVAMMMTMMHNTQSGDGLAMQEAHSGAYGISETFFEISIN